MPSSPSVQETNVVSFSIQSAGNEIPNTYEVLDIHINQRLNRIADAEITLRDGFAPSQTFEISESDTFKPGTEITIELGYENKTEKIFTGIVTKQQLRVGNDDGSTLVVVCKDKALKSVITRKNNIFLDMKDSAIIEQICGDNGLGNAVTATTVEHKEVVQYYTSDWDFMVSRAEINGMVVSTDNGTLTVAEPSVLDSPALKVQYGFDLLEFDGELDSTYQYSGVTGTSWDVTNQATASSDASEPTVNQQGNITGTTLAGALSAGDSALLSSVPMDDGGAGAWANASLLKSRLSMFRGTILFQGSALAKVNSTLELAGLGARFDGNAYISGVTHRVSDGTWTSEATMGLPSQWFAEQNKMEAPPASGLLPGIGGLQTGIVKKTYEDPNNDFRVQVEVPILGVDNGLVWARLATWYNGSGVGAYFMPEVNDEVILGFMNDDPRFPIILGSLYSSSIAAPETPDEKNTFKTLMTRSELKVQFDDEKKIITILTPGNNQMVFSDEDKSITLTDQSGNTIEMSDSGITVESKSDLTLKAAQKVDIQGASISVNGTESIDASGGSVSVSGTQSVDITGSAQCSVKSDGQMEIKGLTVMIN